MIRFIIKFVSRRIFKVVVVLVKEMVVKLLLVLNGFKCVLKRLCFFFIRFGLVLLFLGKLSKIGFGRGIGRIRLERNSFFDVSNGLDEGEMFI